MQEHFPKNKALLVPDMAFFIDFNKFGKINTVKTERILYAKRTDKELKNDIWPSFIPQNAEVHDWPTVEYKVPKYAHADYIVGWLNFFANIKGIKPINRLIDLMRAHFYRPQYIKDCVKFINQYRTIYATRLHIAIASAMMGKKVYLMDNSYGKNFRILNEVQIILFEIKTKFFLIQTAVANSANKRMPEITVPDIAYLFKQTSGLHLRLYP